MPALGWNGGTRGYSQLIVIRESRRAAVIFEPDQGWVPVDAHGTIWRYRTRGSSGVLVFKREGEGQDAVRSFEATHLDRFSNDETITTPSRRKAVRFAVAGTTKKGPSQGGASDERGGSEPGAGEPRIVTGGESARAAGDGGLGSGARAGLNDEWSDVVAGVPGQLYAADAYVLELRRGEYWVDAPGSGAQGVTADPSRASTVAHPDAALLRETLEAVPTARVLRIRVTVTELTEPAPSP